MRQSLHALGALMAFCGSSFLGRPFSCHTARHCKHCNSQNYLRGSPERYLGGSSQASLKVRPRDKVWSVRTLNLRLFHTPNVHCHMLPVQSTNTHREPRNELMLTCLPYGSHGPVVKAIFKWTRSPTLLGLAWSQHRPGRVYFSAKPRSAHQTQAKDAREQHWQIERRQIGRVGPGWTKSSLR